MFIDRHNDYFKPDRYRRSANDPRHSSNLWFTRKNLSGPDIVYGRCGCTVIIIILLNQGRNKSIVIISLFLS
jgi:hypothetical protein